MPFSFPPLTAPFPTLGGSLSSPRQPLRGPLPFFVPLRGNLFAFSPLVGILPPPTRPSANPSRAPANPFVALCRPSCPFVEIFLPFRPSWTSSPPYPTLGEPLSIPRQPLSGPLPFFVPLRGNLFAFFLPAFDGPLPDPRRPPLEPPPTPSRPFAVLRAPSWKSFRLFAPRGHPPPPSRPSANPSRAPANPLVALRRSSCPFVEIFLPFSFSSLTAPFPTLGGPLSSLLQPLRGPSPFFVPLRGNLFVFSFLRAP